MTRDPRVFDVALSFAAENRQVAREIADDLVRRGVAVFYDQYDVDLLWGRDLHLHLSNIYDRSRLIVLLVSEAYTQRSWARFESRAALTRARNNPSTQVFPVALDDSISKFAPTLGYVDMRQVGVERVVDLIVDKLQIESAVPTSEAEKPRVHVIPSEGQWTVKESGAASSVQVLPTREAAIVAARALATGRAIEIVVHRRNGMIETRESMGEGE